MKKNVYLKISPRAWCISNARQVRALEFSHSIVYPGSKRVPYTQKNSKIGAAKAYFDVIPLSFLICITGQSLPFPLVTAIFMIL